MAKKLSIVQDYRYIYSNKKVKAKNIFKNTAQLGNFSPLMWRGGANLPEKRRGGAVAKQNYIIIYNSVGRVE